MSATTIFISRERVGNEFRGLARQFREFVRTEDLLFEQAIAPITAPLRARLARHPKLRPVQIAQTGHSYARTIPSSCRIGGIEGVRDRTRFAITETRVTVSWLHDDGWDDDEREQGLAVCRFTLAVHKGKLLERWLPLANVSLHAVARRIERGADRSHTALLRDLSVLAIPGGPGERVDTDGGYWLGRVVDALDDGRPVKLRNVRTWLSGALQ